MFTGAFTTSNPPFSLVHCSIDPIELWTDGHRVIGKAGNCRVGAKRVNASRWGVGQVREESVSATEKHSGRKITHDRLRLHMQISQHFIGAPATDEADAIRIHIRTQESHGSGCTEGGSGDVAGHEVIGGAQDGNGEAQGGHEIGRAEAGETQGERVKERSQRLRGGGVGVAQMQDATNRGGDGTKMWIATAAQANDLAAHTVLLCSELERDKIGGVELVRGG